MEVEVLDNCRLQWQKERGVLYVYNKDTGATVLRVSGLTLEVARGSLKDGMIDIHHPQHFSFPSGKGCLPR